MGLPLPRNEMMMGRAPVGVSCGQGCELKWLASTNCRVPAMHLQGSEMHARWVVQPKQSTAAPAGAALWVRFTRLLFFCPRLLSAAHSPRTTPPSLVLHLGIPTPHVDPPAPSRKRIDTVRYRRCHHQVIRENPLARYLSQGPTRSRFCWHFPSPRILPAG